MVLAPLYLKCLSGGDASTHTTASAAHVPLDIVAAVGDGVPVVVAFGIAGDGKHLPAAANFDAFDDVDSRHNVSDFGILNWPTSEVCVAHPLNERILLNGLRPRAEELVGLE